MIEPVLADDAFLADVRAASTAAPDQVNLWWLGQSGFLVAWRGRHLLLDPYLSESLTKKYAQTDKPHVRMTRRIVDPARLDFIDVVTSSHNHTDHLDGETLRPLLAANPRLTVVVPAANRAFAADRLGVAPERLTAIDDGQALELGPFRLSAVPSAHEQVDRDEQGRCRYLGYLLRVGPLCLYHTGDSCDFDGLAERLRPFAVDLALLPINGRKPERRVPGNMWGREAAALAHRMGARLCIPHHFDMFQFNTETPDELLDACARLGQPVRVLGCGERWQSGAIGIRTGAA